MDEQETQKVYDRKSRAEADGRPLCPSMSVRQHATTGIYWSEYDRRIDDPSAAVVSVVAALRGEDPRDLVAMYGSFDPEALDRLILSSEDDVAPHVEFRYAGCEILIDTTRVTARPDASRPDRDDG